MTLCTEKQIEVYFERYGWAFQATSHRSWLSGWSSQNRFYQLHVTLSDTFVSFDVEPLVDFTLNWVEYPDLLAELHSLNRDCKIAKLFISHSDKIVLNFTCLRSGFDCRQWEIVLGLLGYYADNLHDEISHILQRSGLIETNLVPVFS
jgi:hypothetical protein